MTDRQIERHRLRDMIVTDSLTSYMMSEVDVHVDTDRSEQQNKQYQTIFQWWDLKWFYVNIGQLTKG